MGARKSEHNRIAKIMREGRAKSSKKTGYTLEHGTAQARKSVKASVSQLLIYPEMIFG
jgi:hypothetical protein